MNGEGDQPGDEPPEEPPDPEAGKDRPSRIGRFVDPELNLLRGAQEHIVMPAWRRVTQGEPRWPVTMAVIAAITLQLLLPDQVANRHRWILPTAAAALLVALIVSNPRRITRQSAALRAASMILIAVISIGNAWSAGRLIVGLVRGTEGQTAGPLLLTGAAIWLTNVIVFALWYWELDRGGPAARAVAPRPHPDFLFAQMQSPELAPDDWEPEFADYLYLSFTNATAFSPTDVLPLSRWAKLTMMLHSLISLATVALVIARAVNILKG